MGGRIKPMGKEIVVVNEALHSGQKRLIEAGYFFHRKFSWAVFFQKHLCFLRYPFSKKRLDGTSGRA